jgi:hypothetical protein
MKPVKTNVYNIWEKWMKTVSGSMQNVEQQMFEINENIMEKI